MDQPIAGLLGDLKRRGLLDDTVVVFAGEFGRTTFAQSMSDEDRQKYGRDHHPRCFTTWMAGGGIKGGVSRAVYHDNLKIHARVLASLGIEGHWPAKLAT